MQVVYTRCCGLDVHKKSVTACLLTPKGSEIRTFGTMTCDLLKLAGWLNANQCEAAAMESTGVYWKPIFNLLEDYEMEVMVVNAHHMKSLPGRKTDVSDAEWIADLLKHGLIRGSFIPPRWQRELRELVRYRKDLVHERSREANRIQKVLEGANIKLGSVATDVLGRSGRDMLTALVSGETDPELLASMARGKLKNKREELIKALEGLMGPHQRMLLATQLKHIDFLDQQLADLDAEIKERMLPFLEQIEALDAIPGVGRRTAEEVISETGVDMSRFPSDRHISAWAGVCPGNNESGGKRRSSKRRHGNPHLRTTLVEAAHSAARTRGTYLSAQYHRIAARRGGKRAALAVGHSMLVIIYHMLKDGSEFCELGGDYFDKLNKEAIVRRSKRRLEALGYKVTVEQVA